MQQVLPFLHNADKRSNQKILLFIGILSCLVLAVNL